MKNKFILGILSSILLLSTLVGCGSKSENKSGYNVEQSSKISDSSYVKEAGINKDDMAIKPNQASSTSTTGTIESGERKIINKAEILLETLNFDKSITSLEEYIKKYNGYIESSSINQNGIMKGDYAQSRSGDFVIRIPKEEFLDFITTSGELGVITNKRVYGEDISSQYYDKEARLKVLNSQEERYLAILANAKDIKEILEIEKSLTEIRYEIESITGYLKQMDSLVSYSTINLNMIEVIETTKIEKTPKNLGEKIIKAFTDSVISLKSILVLVVIFIVAIIPYGVIFGTIGYVGYFIYKKYRYKK